MARNAKGDKKSVTFTIEANGAGTVYVAGTFNGWNPAKNPLRKKDGVYATTLAVPRGKHEYKFIVDDTWMPDPNCEKWVPNDMGSLNSVVTVD